MGRKKLKDEYAETRHVWTYFVLSEELNRVKIGFSTENPSKRLKSMQVGSPSILIPLAVIYGGLGVEFTLHAKFKKYRLHGEWFEYSEEIAEFIRKYGGPWPDPTKSSSWYNIIPIREGPDERDEYGRGLPAKIVGYKYFVTDKLDDTDEEIV